MLCTGINLPSFGDVHKARSVLLLTVLGPGLVYVEMLTVDFMHNPHGRICCVLEESTETDNSLHEMNRTCLNICVKL